jgi:ribosomal protein S18 acetylase RimI-like enzyme
MIKTELTTDDALQILELGKQLHQESHFRDEPFDGQRCWNLLGSTISNPTERFIAFDSEYRGFILLGMSEHFFSGKKIASDYCFYVKPEHRGSTVAWRLLLEARKWAAENKAISLTIFHNTGIDIDKAQRLFTKLGFDMKGYIFTQEFE